MYHFLIKVIADRPFSKVYNDLMQ